MSTTPAPLPNSLNIPQRVASPSVPYTKNNEQFAIKTRVQEIGIIQSFDAVAQTVTVRLVTTENIIKAGAVVQQDPYLLSDVPIIMPRAGGFAITFPIQPGDECIVHFCDKSFDAWHQSGDDTNNQIVWRRHDLSDGVAAFAVWSTPNALAAYSTDSMQIRNDEGTIGIDIAAGKITIICPAIEAAATAGDGTPVLLAAFLTWFQTVYMPSVVYVSTPPTVPSTGMKSTVFVAE
jgi:hypothetical protein